eukprot:scaffold258260_cov35-Tisochrysis_lutea.AAC.5
MEVKKVECSLQGVTLILLLEKLSYLSLHGLRDVIDVLWLNDGLRRNNSVSVMSKPNKNSRASCALGDQLALRAALVHRDDCPEMSALFAMPKTEAKHASTRSLHEQQRAGANASQFEASPLACDAPLGLTLAFQRRVMMC